MNPSSPKWRLAAFLFLALFLLSSSLSAVSQPAFAQSEQPPGPREASSTEEPPLGEEVPRGDDFPAPQDDLPPAPTFLMPEAFNDKNAPDTLGGFTGIGLERDTDGFLRFPPDTHAAVSATRIVEVTNSHVGLYNKSGALIAGGDSGAGAMMLGKFCGETDPNNSCFDPKVIYDQYSKRFVVVILFGNDYDTSLVYMLVSKDDSPENLTTDWVRIKTTGGISVNGNQGWTDYPGLGVSPDAIVVTGNIFPSFGSALGTLIRIFPKTDLYDGNTSSNFKNIVNDTNFGFTFQPAHHFGTPPAGTFYLVSHYNIGKIKVVKLTNVLSTNPTVTSTFLDINEVGDCVSDAPQKDGGFLLLDTVCFRMMDAVWRDNALWGVYTGADNTNSRSQVRWFEINTASTPAMKQQGVIDGGTGEHTFLPAISVDKCGNAAMVYAQSSSSRYPEIRYTGRMKADPVNTMRIPKVSKTSVSHYQDVSNSGRWGDYAAVSLDPTDQSFWTAHEYVKKGPGLNGDGRWGTYISHFTFNCTTDTPVNNKKIYLPFNVNQDDLSAGFSDDFSSDKGWESQNYPGGSTYYKNGEFYLKETDKDFVNRVLAPSSVTVPGSFTAEVDVRQTLGVDTNYGLVFNFKTDTFYTVYVDPNTQTFSVWYFNLGWNELASGGSAAIKSGNASNHLKLVRTPTNIKFYVNGAMLANVNTASTTGGRIGLEMWMYTITAEAAYDNFTMTPLVP